MTFPDLIKELVSNSKSRIKHPILASFITSWILYNWDSILIVLLSESSISDRIIIAKATYEGKEGSFYIPVIFAFTFVLVLPYISLALDYLRKRAISIKRKRNDDFEISKLILEKDLAIYRYEIAQNESGQKTTEEFVQKIESLAEEKRAIEKINSEQRDQLTKALDAIKDKNEEIIKHNSDLERLNKDFKYLSGTNNSLAKDHNELKNKSELLTYKLEQIKTLILNESDKTDSQLSFYLKVRKSLLPDEFKILLEELYQLKNRKLSSKEFSNFEFNKTLKDQELAVIVNGGSKFYSISISGLNFIKIAEIFGDAENIKIRSITTI